MRPNTNPYRVSGHITKNFHWYEALYLPQWRIYVCPTDFEYENIIKTARKMQIIRDFLGKKIKVTSWIRPQKYNEKIGGALLSQHINGLACDFYVDGLTSDEVRQILLPHLEEWGIRMEDAPGAFHVHIDLGDVINKRYFKP